MIVVADTSPIHYLVQLGEAGLLPRLYKDVWTTPTVTDELSHASTPAEVRAWVASPPGWLHVRHPLEAAGVVADASLDRGEATAIALALELGASLVLLDDQRAVRVARALGLVTPGTLAVLFEAGLNGWLDFPDTLGRLERDTNFWMSATLRDRVLASYIRAKEQRP